MEIFVLIVIGIGAFAFLTGNASVKEVGKFWIGIIAKIFYSAIAIGLCMAIPIPVINVGLAIYFVLQIWGSPVEF